MRRNVFVMSDWRGSLGGVLPKIHTLDALVEVVPELSKYVKGGKVTSSSNEVGLERTESEEREYQYALSVKAMQKEKQENRELLDSVKKAQERDSGSLYENEISLLRDSIREKQQLINKMHEKCMSLAATTNELELKLKDQQDHTKGVRESLCSKAKRIEEDIKGIQEDRLCAKQRLHQYKLLHSRTKEDRDAAEVRMQRTRELVEKSREDLFTMKEYHNTARHAEEQATKELEVEKSRLEASRTFWKSSLEKKKREVDSLICRYERSKQERLKRVEEEDQRAEAERRVLEKAKQDLSSQQQALEDAARERAIRRDQWELLCAAAGLEKDASASDVIAAYNALKEMHARLEQKAMHNVKAPQDDDSKVDDGDALEEGMTLQSTEKSRRDTVPSETSVHSRQNTVDHGVACRSINGLNCVAASYTADSEAAIENDAIFSSIGKGRISEQVERIVQCLGQKSSTSCLDSGARETEDTIPAVPCQMLTTQSLSPNYQRYSFGEGQLLGEKDPVDLETDTNPLTRIDQGESKPVLQREDIKSRSAKLKARIDKQRWMTHM